MSISIDTHAISVCRSRILIEMAPGPIGWPHRLRSGETATQGGSRLLTLARSRPIESVKSQRASVPAGSPVAEPAHGLGPVSTFARLLALILGTPALSAWRHSPAFSLADAEHHDGRTFLRGKPVDDEHPDGRQCNFSMPLTHSGPSGIRPHRLRSGETATQCGSMGHG
jgi:hypothetical protein